MEEKTLMHAAPVDLSERIESLDVLRGFAVLGILIMNIQSFSMIGAAYANPTAYGDLSGANLWVWVVSHVLADQKFMSLFSMLFGAGIVLFCQRAESKGARPAVLHYRRNLWLIVFGLLHAHLLWYGDILFSYGVCAMIVYPFRKCPPPVLFNLGVLSLTVCALLYLFFAWSIPYWPEEQYRVSVEQHWAPTAEIIDEELAAYQGSWMEQNTVRMPASLMMQTFVLFIFVGWRAGGMMLIGMALFKWGILSGKAPRFAYRLMLAAGLLIGFPLVVFGAWMNFREGWAYDYSMFLGSQFNYWGSVLVAFAYVAGVVSFVQSRRARRVQARLAEVGRTAFSNYILQTLICVTLFYGLGFGWFGRVERIGQIGIVVAVWMLQVWLSHWWSRRFRFGPLEWLWRSLTYWRVQPMKK